MRMEAGLDTGPMLLRETVPIGSTATTPLLHDTLSELGANMILQALAQEPRPLPQPDEGVTYAAKLTRADGKLDFSRDAVALDRQIRALTPWPGSFALFGGETLKILAATLAEGSGPAGHILDSGLLVACGTGALRLTKVQRPGRPAVTGEAFLHGVPGWDGTVPRDISFL
jgi:methionyl-tRNA formyltransferase